MSPARRSADGVERASPALRLGWRQAGLTERQAAAHLLDRLTFGPRRGEVDRVLEQGLEAWVQEQLTADRREPRLVERLGKLGALALTVREFPEVYPRSSVVGDLARAAGDGGANGEARMEGADPGVEGGMGRKRLTEFARERGFRSPQELVAQLRAQKVLRAVYGENQLREVLTDFWFNHFNVSITDSRALTFVLAYERDAIRPNVLAHFRQLLEATAKHPAMLFYLDNAQSTAPADAPTTMQVRSEIQYRRSGVQGGARLSTGPRPEGEEKPERIPGLNENYARELLELHTLGVDGGYTQQDVIEVARAFTGWMLRPTEDPSGEFEARIERGLALDVGFVLEGGFVFRPDFHDAGPKVVLGRELAAGRGIEDGEEVLDLVALHPATARRLAGKLAARLVSDRPPAPLVERLAERYLASAGDLAEVVAALLEFPEFWAPEARFAKIKSPFEVAASAVRAVQAEVEEPDELVDWVARMGQPLYACPAPTGYPDEAEFWVSTGSLLNRMNFGLALASGGIDGVAVDLPALHPGPEPESREAALATYLALLLPERDLESTAELLRPLVTDPAVAPKVAAAADREREATSSPGAAGEDRGVEPAAGGGPRRRSPPAPSPLEQVVGVILGSPEFQRR